MAISDKSTIHYLAAHPKQFQTKENQATTETCQTAAQKVVISLAFKLFIEGGRREVIRAIGPDDQPIAEVSVFGLSIELLTGGTRRQIGRYRDGQWLQVTMHLNFQDATMDVFLDGTLAADGAPFANPAASLAKIIYGAEIGSITYQQLFVYPDPQQSIQALQPKHVVRVADYIAAANQNADQTALLQRLIDQCEAQGGGFLYFDAGTYRTSSIELKQGVSFYLDKGATIQGIVGGVYPVKDNPSVKNWNMLHQGPHRALIYGDDLSDFSLQGRGTIDGGGYFPGGDGSEPTRPSLILLVNCHHFEISGLNIQNAGMWTLPLISCSDIYLHDIQLKSIWSPNRDGFDLCDCQDVLVEQCVLQSDDDVICIKSGTRVGCSDTLIRNCCLSSMRANALKFGTYSYGGYRDIHVENCLVKDNRLAAICIETIDGGATRNLSFKNITIDHCGFALFIVSGDRGMTPPWEKPKLGSVDGITLTNIFATNLTRAEGNYIGGLVKDGQTYLAKNIRLENVHIEAKGGVQTSVVGQPFEFDHSMYPEAQMFGNLPAAGLFIRHAQVTMDDQTEITVFGQDVRPAIKELP